VNAAVALGWVEQTGRIAPGLQADLLLTTRQHTDPHRSVLLATERDVTLVTVGGRPVYGTVAAMRDAAAVGAEPIAVGRLRRSVALVHPGVPDADMSWPQVLQALADAATAPRTVGGVAVRDAGAARRGGDGLAALRGWDGSFDADGLPAVPRLRSAPGDDPGDEEQLYLLPDLPPVLDADPDQPAQRAVDPAELADIVVPPVDTLATDDRFLATLASSPIGGAALAGLADYWR
jgi:hypothetical protein